MIIKDISHLFNISSSMLQLLNRQNFNLKKYFFNKYQLKENETQLKTWPMLYLSSIKFATDFLKDIFHNLKLYKILYNKSIILLNSINISLGNCFMNEIEPEYPLNVCKVRGSNPGHHKKKKTNFLLKQK